MKNLLIIGARGFGREVYYTATQSKGIETEFKIKGFLDDNEDALAGLEGYPPILDSVENYIPKPDDLFITALGSVETKKKYSEIILKKGGKFYTVIHQNAIVDPTSQIGEGCIIMRDVSISSNVKVGDHVTVMPNSIIGHDAAIGKWSHIGPMVFMGGYSEADECVQLNVRSTILAKIKLGRHSVVGAGSVVIKYVDEYTTVFGNPAKNIHNHKHKTIE